MNRQAFDLGELDCEEGNRQLQQQTNKQTDIREYFSSFGFAVMAVRCRPLVTPKEKSDFYRKSRKEACIRASHLTVALLQQYSARYPLIGRPDKLNVKL